MVVKIPRQLLDWCSQIHIRPETIIETVLGYTSVKRESIMKESLFNQTNEWIAYEIPDALIHTIKNEIPHEMDISEAATILLLTGYIMGL